MCVYSIEEPSHLDSTHGASAKINTKNAPLSQAGKESVFNQKKTNLLLHGGYPTPALLSVPDTVVLIVIVKSPNIYSSYLLRRSIWRECMGCEHLAIMRQDMLA